MERQQNLVAEVEMEVQGPNPRPHLHLPQWAVNLASHRLHQSQRSFLPQSKVSGKKHRQILGDPSSLIRGRSGQWTRGLLLCSGTVQSCLLPKTS